jgi:glycosyltransferase involved in cell wall biosynthesis
MGLPMKVLQVITDRDRRGAQVFAMDLHDGLTDLGIEVGTVALTAGRHGDLLPIPALGPTRLSWSSIRNLRTRAQSHDVVVAHGSSTLPACALALAVTGVPFVYRQISDPRFWAASWPRRLRVAIMLRRAAKVVTLSPRTSEVVREHYRLQSTAITVIPNAVPGHGFRPPRAEERHRARAALGLPTDGDVVAYVGALVEEKGVDAVVRAAASLPEVSFLVVGDGPERSKLEHLADEVAPGRVTFTGSLPSALEALFAADVVALPSRGGDSMPAVLIEAGLCGVPVVTTPIGAIPELIIDGETGLIVPACDQELLTSALAGLVADPGQRGMLGDAAARRCREHFTIEATATTWRDLLAGVARRAI